VLYLLFGTSLPVKPKNNILPTHELKKPILFLGLGQEYKDFEKFNKEKFVNTLLGV
jgi:hypothetical protein